jgi:hypothetical protein
MKDENVRRKSSSEELILRMLGSQVSAKLVGPQGSIASEGARKGTGTAA